MSVVDIRVMTEAMTDALKKLADAEYEMRMGSAQRKHQLY